MISWIVVIVFLLFQGVIAMNVIPVYLTDSSVKSIMEELPNDVKARDASVNELKILVIKRLSMNSVYSIKPDNIKVVKGRGENIVTIEYEPRGKLIGTLDYIVSFKHEAKVPSR
jgi:type III secretory pathway lipoprotein EscJ